MKRLIVLVALSFLGCKTQDVKPTESYSEQADSYVSFLASDKLEGRDSGSEGIHQAASYIEDHFRELKVKPFFETYRDSFKIREIDAYNVVGWLEGNHPELKKEVILIGAHYDHIGLRTKPIAGDSIGNGANDNATGTAGVMLLADYFAITKTNKRSLVFALFSGEEMGLRGSKHLSSRLKAQNMDLYTMINFEMIGVPLNDRDYAAFVSGYDLSNLADKMNEYAGKKLIGRSDVAVQYELFKRSDNYPFYLEFKVPCQTISSCDLSNYDFYHHVDDESNKQDYNHLSELIKSIAPVIETMSQTDSKEIQLKNE
ncbi:MAG: M28 family peptidase [Bacteroidia bacterium]|nr:M28 family peptidase [Bacteroidia bacterium]MBT8269074.1 M28 family peptidase [Bacteroidia bacterium]NNF81140.1 M28 family peptidase [Flavobacteriaceae bacterium]NNK69855.1 M28 family peptidase [Flavobacteriaceae bacterium]NNL81047.1 M28 family peptidase [Flavobacteriaceae bacterium]